ncbi:hypothetical protein [Mycobacterium sp.]|uniref:hypothetical protein n=1 Tax=Mycobacterium sp. TaxID=1785 RepID=UPI002D0B38E6|nr:hypothetical protein [Mycobacterium sp.]HME46817.1 hypothetical protein [Mycobacterium sp.]
MNMGFAFVGWRQPLGSIATVARNAGLAQLGWEPLLPRKSAARQADLPSNESGVEQAERDTFPPWMS